jgi:GNAT superfamily N-acetyltransferase
MQEVTKQKGPMQSRVSDKNICIHRALKGDLNFATCLIDYALTPYYGGDHRATAARIFEASSKGIDPIGYFSLKQNLFIISIGTTPAGLINVVKKRQGNYKISPIAVLPSYQNLGLGNSLTEFAEKMATADGARQMYCTVSESNLNTLRFFSSRGYIYAGKAENHYKPGLTEIMLYKPLLRTMPPSVNGLRVIPLNLEHSRRVNEFVLQHLPSQINGIDEGFVDAIFNGYGRRSTYDVHRKYKLVFVVVDDANEVEGVAVATPKKGDPIRVMPLLALNLESFGLLVDRMTSELSDFGRKLYLHIAPNSKELMILQKKGWRIDGALPDGYKEDVITLQLSYEYSTGYRSHYNRVTGLNTRSST